MKNRECSYYDLNNPYLTIDEKVEVECWFQLPGAVFTATFTASALAFSFGMVPWYLVALLPFVMNLLVAIPNWYWYRKTVCQSMFFILGIPHVQKIVGIVVGLVIIVKGPWWLGILVVAAGFGALIPFEIHILVYCYLAAPHGLHPKYLFFRRFYGKRFSFESD